MPPAPPDPRPEPAAPPPAPVPTPAEHAPRIDLATWPKDQLASYLTAYGLAPECPPPLVGVRARPRPHAVITDARDDLSSLRPRSPQAHGEQPVPAPAQAHESQPPPSPEQEKETASPAAKRPHPSRDEEDEGAGETLSARSAAPAASKRSRPGRELSDPQPVAARAERPSQDTGDIRVSELDEATEHDKLAAVANRHFADMAAPKEGEVVVHFLYKCRTRGRVLRIPGA